MMIDHKAFDRRPITVADLPDDEALLLWSIRRIVVAWPRSHVVQAALHSRYGDAGLGVEHLIRCLLVGVSRHTSRQLIVGDPNCTLVIGDEPALLMIIRLPESAASALIALTGNPCADCLAPLAAAYGVATAPGRGGRLSDTRAAALPDRA